MSIHKTPQENTLPSPGHTIGQGPLLHKVEESTLHGAPVAQTMPVSLGYPLSLFKASSAPRKALTSGQ